MKAKQPIYLYEEQFAVARQCATKVYKKQKKTQHKKVTLEYTNGIERSIGTYQEKSVHSVLKYFFEPDDNCHEVAMDGYCADIYTKDMGVIEIQSKQLYRLQPKLAAFLKQYPVTVVYPIACDTWIVTVDTESGEVLERRKSPKHGTVYDGLVELYTIREYLKYDNLHIRFVQMDVEEYKTTPKPYHKRGRTYMRKEKIDKVPIGIREMNDITQKEDYLQFLPFDLPETFTVKTFAKWVKIPVSTAGIALLILYNMGAVTRIGKEKNAYIYCVNER